MSQKKIIAEKFFSEVRYSGKHDRTLKWVRDSTVDLGVVNSKIAEKIFKRDAFTKNKVRVLLETPNYNNYVWAVHPAIDEHSQIKVRKAFLKLSEENSKHKKILDQWNAHYFSPASIEDFLIIRKIVKKLKQE